MSHECLVVLLYSLNGMNTHNFTRKFLPSNKGGFQVIRLLENQKIKRKKTKRRLEGFLEFTEMTVKSWAPVVILNNPFFKESSTPYSQQYLLSK